MHIKVSSDNDALNLSKLLNDGNWMVLYYADWCGHCKTMKPEWQKVVDNLSNPGNNITNKVNVAEIESQHIGKLLNKPEIEGFPTIKMYNKGKEIANFEDERIASKIEEFANNNSRKETKTESNKQSSKLNIKLNNSDSFSAPTEPKPEIKLNDIKIDNLIKKINNKMEKPIMEKPIMEKPIMEKPKINILDLSCSSIIRAKPCKSNPKCMYDGTDFKCKDKIFKVKTKSIKKDKIGNIIMKNHSIKSKNKSKGKAKGKSIIKQQRRRSHKGSHKESHKGNHKGNHKGSHKTKNNNVKKTTKTVFEQLIKSFERIGDEAEKDSKLLKTASNKLS
jgi:thiol-disulfide isomerase/thioredoxin